MLNSIFNLVNAISDQNVGPEPFVLQSLSLENDTSPENSDKIALVLR